MRKEKQTYYFSVEGWTEKWYLDWLQKIINSNANSRYNVKFDVQIQKDPESRIKRMTIVSKTKITHVFDYESNSPEHEALFKQTLDKMKNAQSCGKNVTYTLGYSNFTFELWILLHKTNFTNPLSDRKQYLRPINEAFETHFISLDEYKHEANFNSILNKLSLDDVHAAINRSKQIMQHNADYGFTIQQYKGFHYYKENPSLSIWKTIESILNSCNI